MAVMWFLQRYWRLVLLLLVILLSYRCNKSVLYGTFPTRLKYATVNPLLKKGDKENVANYIPISLLTLFSKVFYKLYDRLLKLIETNNV